MVVQVEEIVQVPNAHEEQGTKVCTKCREELPVDRFSRQSKAPDGRAYWCKSCYRAYHAARFVPAPPKPPKQLTIPGLLSRKRDLVDPEYRRERRRAWREANREKNQLSNRASDHRRRANGRKKHQGRTYDITIKDLRRLKNSPCNHCGATTNIELDHVIPLKKRGRNTIGNLQPLCSTCNRLKGTSLYAQFRYRRP